MWPKFRLFTMILTRLSSRAISFKTLTVPSSEALSMKMNSDLQHGMIAGADVAEVPVVHDDLDALVVASDLLQDLNGAVFRSVVDENEFRSATWHDSRSGCGRSSGCSR